jgi:hypothetical protein
MANEFVVQNGLLSLDNSIVSGSLNVTQGITGSLLGTASIAVTASYATAVEGGIGVASLIAGDGLLGGTISSSGVISLNTASTHFIDGITNAISTVSIEPVSVTSSFQGILASSQISITTNDVSKATIISSSVNTSIFDATEVIGPPFSINSYSGVSVEYVAQRPSGIRTGVLYASWSGSNISFTDISNNDVGDTEDLSFHFIRLEDDVLLRAYSAGSGSGNWTIQCLYKVFPNLL